MSTQFDEQLKQEGLLNQSNRIFENLSSDELIDLAVEMNKGKLTKDGALYVETGKHTGRAAQDKYVVECDLSNQTIDWKNNIRKMSKEIFSKVKGDIITHLQESQDLFVQVRSVGADEKYNMNVCLVTTEPQDALFMNNMFRAARKTSGLKPYTIYHAPFLEIDHQKYNLRSETVISLDLETREVLIAGTQYAGEIKKSIFSVMNYILPENGLLPMHAGANLGAQGDVSVFFGLSGTGKTTLSTDTGRKLIGDDEHGLSDVGIFNFEGGCYAKTYKLSKENEPEIFKTTRMRGSLLENVEVDENGEPDFFSNELTENGRVSYPLDFIANIVEDSRGGVPNNIFFLCADAFGVLPAISRLDVEQAKYYFLSGYTAKLAGTEVGVKEPQATFSTCFGAPFMMRPGKEYAQLLENYITKHNIHVWLVNTGWTGGGYGAGERFPIKTTRGLIRAAQANKLQNVEFRKEKAFGLNIPVSVEAIPTEQLDPKASWENATEYDEVALHLRQMFEENFKKYK